MSLDVHNILNFLFSIRWYLISLWYDTSYESVNKYYHSNLLLVHPLLIWYILHPNIYVINIAMDDLKFG